MKKEINVKKICFLCPGLSQNGGLERVVCNLANQFSLNGYEVTLTVLNKKNKGIYFEINNKIKLEYLNELQYKNNGIIRRMIGKILIRHKESFLKNPELRKEIFFPKDHTKYYLCDHVDYFHRFQGALKKGFCLSKGESLKILGGWIKTLSEQLQKLDCVTLIVDLPDMIDEDLPW